MENRAGTMPAGSAGSPRDRDVRLYMFFRLVLLFSVIVSLVIYQQSGILSQDMTIKTYFVTFFTFLVTTGFIFLYEKAADVPYFLVSQVAYDILFTTVLTFYTGPFESMYTTFYLFNIVFAAIMFPRAGAILAALASAVLYATIAWINSDSSNEGRAFSLLTTITAFISLSLLASQLVEELRRSRQRISRLEELSEEIVNSLDSGLLGIDSAGLIKKVNRTAQEMLEVKQPSDLLGRAIRGGAAAIAATTRSAASRRCRAHGRMARGFFSRKSRCPRITA